MDRFACDESDIRRFAAPIAFSGFLETGDNFPGGLGLSLHNGHQVPGVLQGFWTVPLLQNMSLHQVPQNITVHDGAQCSVIFSSFGSKNHIPDRRGDVTRIWLQQVQVGFILILSWCDFGTSFT